MSAGLLLLFSLERANGCPIDDFGICTLLSILLGKATLLRTSELMGGYDIMIDSSMYVECWGAGLQLQKKKHIKALVTRSGIRGG